MAYSRWGDSRFYTFWAATDATRAEDEVFELCNFGSRRGRWTYAQISADLGSCVQEVADAYAKPDTYRINRNALDVHAEPEWEKSTVDADPLSCCEIGELEGYMREFMEDVERRYGVPS